MSKIVKCNICLEENIENPVFTPCIHGFCSECISKWIDEKKQYIRIPCPVCKFDIAPLAGDRDESQLYDESEPLPPNLLRSTVDLPRFFLRGSSFDENINLPVGFLRRIYNTRRRSVRRPVVQPQTLNVQLNLDGLLEIINIRRHQAAQSVEPSDDLPSP